MQLLQIDAITAGSILIATNINYLNRENYEPILTVKIIEWREFIDYFSLNIEADPYRVGKKNVYFVRMGYIPRLSSIDIHISRPHLDKELNL